jgi:hypothetical protein
LIDNCIFAAHDGGNRREIMERRKRVKNYNFHPLVAYVKSYLLKAKPGPDASEIQRDRYAMALKCVKEMEKALKGKNVVIGKLSTPGGCGGGPWPLKPPIGGIECLLMAPTRCGKDAEGPFPLRS